MRIFKIAVGSKEPGCVGQTGPDYIARNSEPSVFVVFTTTDATLKAIEKEDEIADTLGLSIALVAAQMIPFPLPINKPVVSIDFLIEQLRTIANRIHSDIKAFILLCRDPLEALKTVIGINSPVFLGVDKGIWRSRDMGLAQMLLRAGFAVFLVHAEGQIQ